MQPTTRIQNPETVDRAAIETDLKTGNEVIIQFSHNPKLVIDEQIQLKSMDINENLAALTSLRLRDCKTFASLTGLKKLTSLEHLQIWKTNLKFESLLTLGLPKTLKAFSFSTTKKKEDLLIINPQLLALGYREANWQDFESAH